MSWHKMLTAAFFSLLLVRAKYKNCQDRIVRIVPVFRYEHAFHASTPPADKMNASCLCVLSSYKTVICCHFYVLSCKNPFYHDYPLGAVKC